MQNIDNKTIRNCKFFGIIWGIILIFIALNNSNIAIVTISIILSLIFIKIAIIKPQLFYQYKIYQNWIIFGNIMGKINSFIIISLLFFCLFTPISLILKILKKQLLIKKPDKAATSYFIDSDNDNNMSHQF